MSNERVTCELLIGCGLSLEIVAGVDQEGPPEEAGAKAGFEETQNFSNEVLTSGLPWVSSGPAIPVVMPLGFPYRRYQFNTWS